MLSPTTKTYIDDLIRENYFLKAKIDKTQQQIKLERIRLYEDAELTGYSLHLNKMGLSQELTTKAGKRFAHISLLVCSIYDMQQAMKENLDKIEGLRNGTIKEI